MALTEKKINYNYSQAINNAKKLEEMASYLEKNALEKFRLNIENLKSAWSGSAAQKYIGASENVSADLQSTVANIRALANHIRREAKSIKDVETRQLPFGGGSGGGFR